MYKIKFVNNRLLFVAKNFSLIIIFILAREVSCFSQVYGCKDPAANNYNAAATINDGSCTYNTVSYIPLIKVDPINNTLIETSGLQMAGNFLWSFNDGGGAAAIYRIDTLSNTILQTVTIGGAANKDWEDIAFDGTNFYVGDFGNNMDGARTDLKIYKFALSAIPDYTANPTVTIPPNLVEVISFTYSDQPQPTVATSANNTKFDCEAMIIDNAQIHLFSKNWIDVNTTHYVINGLAAGNYMATPVDTLDTGYLVTAADKAPGQAVVALLGYQGTGLGNHYMHLLSDYSGGNYFNGNKRKIDLPDATVMGQAEGITFRNDSYGYISNEKLFLINQKLRSFDVSGFIPFYALPLSLKSFNVNVVDGSNKITWSFNDEVENLTIEYSSNGVNFTVLKIFANSLKDIFYNKPSNLVNYYRISWQSKNGAKQYSNIISIKNEEPRAINRLSLKANGELSFLLSGNSPVAFSFKLVSTDGKVLSQTKQQTYLPGLNKIHISKKAVVNNFVYVTVYTDKIEKTIFLHAEK